jgi:hypothetical protein
MERLFRPETKVAPRDTVEIAQVSRVAQTIAH